jgi:hypothetical protein
VAARRLVIVMLVLLGLSTLAAALLPPPKERTATTTEQQKAKHERSRKGNAPRETNRGMLLVARMRISNRPPKTVRIERGDELRLGVGAPFGDDIEIPGLGRTATVTASAPAEFDLFASRIGTFPVRAVDSGRLAGRLLVGKPGTGYCGVSTPATPRGRASTPSCARLGKPGSGGPGRSSRQP